MACVENMFNGVYVEFMKKMGYGEAYGEAVLLVFICVIISFIISHKLGEFGRKGRFPPGPFAWPLIGHIHHVRNLPHQSLANLSKKYGPIVGLRLGQQTAVAISSPELAKEVLATSDKVFANRPPYDFTSEIFYGPANDMIFCRHSPKWRKQRRLCSMSLFTAKRLQELAYIRQEEIASLLVRLHAHASAAATTPVHLGRSIGEMSSRTLMRLLLSNPSPFLGSENLVDLIEEIEHQASIPTLGDLFPRLSYLGFSRKQQMNSLRDRFEKVISTLIAEHIQTPRDDLLQALLSKEASHDPSIPPQESFTLDEIKTIILDMLAAGVHTTTNTLEWAMAELLRNPHCFQRLQEEIDTQLGKKKQITDADTTKLGYLKCVVKEVLRLHPVVPMLLPRISIEECKLSGYTVPVNTITFVNAWAIQRDETLWPHANEFVPERFEGKEVDVKGQNFELLPFGSGRRVCLGMAMALSVLDVTIANLVNSFDWELPHGETHTSINMAEKSGITATRATPLMAIPKPRI